MASSSSLFYWLLHALLRFAVSRARPASASVAVTALNLLVNMSRALALYEAYRVPCRVGEVDESHNAGDLSDGHGRLTPKAFRFVQVGLEIVYLDVYHAPGSALRSAIYRR